MREKKIPYEIGLPPARRVERVTVGRAVWWTILGAWVGLFLGLMIGSEIAFKSVREELADVHYRQGENSVLAEQAAESCARADSILNARSRR